MTNQSQTHTDDELRLLAKELRESSFFNSYLELKEDQSFIELPLREQLYLIFEQVKAKREIIRYQRLRRKSFLPDAIEVKPIEKALSNNGQPKKHIDFIIETVLKRSGKIIFVTGPTGAGKTTIVQNILDRVMRNQMPTGFFDYASWIFDYSSEYLRDHAHYKERMKQLMQNALIAFDDAILCEPVPREGEIFKELLSYAESYHVSLIFASQINVEDWYGRFKSTPEIAESIADRAFKDAIKLVLSGDSLRRSKIIELKGEPKNENNSSTTINK